MGGSPVPATPENAPVMAPPEQPVHNTHPVGPEKPVPPIYPVGPEVPPEIHPVGPEVPPGIHPVGPEVPQPIYPVGPEVPPSPPEIHPVGPEQPDIHPVGPERPDEESTSEPEYSPEEEAEAEAAFETFEPGMPLSEEVGAQEQEEEVQNQEEGEEEQPQILIGTINPDEEEQEQPEVEQSIAFNRERLANLGGFFRRLIGSFFNHNQQSSSIDSPADSNDDDGTTEETTSDGGKLTTTTRHLPGGAFMISRSFSSPMSAGVSGVIQVQSGEDDAEQPQLKQQEHIKLDTSGIEEEPDSDDEEPQPQEPVHHGRRGGCRRHGAGPHSLFQRLHDLIRGDMPPPPPPPQVGSLMDFFNRRRASLRNPLWDMQDMSSPIGAEGDIEIEIQPIEIEVVGMQPEEGDTTVPPSAEEVQAAEQVGMIAPHSPMVDTESESSPPSFIQGRMMRNSVADSTPVPIPPPDQTPTDPDQPDDPDDPSGPVVPIPPPGPPSGGETGSASGGGGDDSGSSTGGDEPHHHHHRHGHHKKWKQWLKHHRVLVAIVGVAMLLVLAGCCYACIKRRRRRHGGWVRMPNSEPGSVVIAAPAFAAGLPAAPAASQPQPQYNPYAYPGAPYAPLPGSAIEVQQRRADMRQPLIINQ
jgi:hypothetical protein